MGLLGGTVRVAAVHSLQFGLGTKVAEVVDWRLAYPEKTVRDSAVADPMGSAGSCSFVVVVAAAAAAAAEELVVEHSPESPVIRMDCRNLRSR
jgi:hypothetical protein